jgi:YD repeat-containing protein
MSWTSAIALRHGSAGRSRAFLGAVALASAMLLPVQDAMATTSVTPVNAGIDIGTMACHDCEFDEDRPRPPPLPVKKGYVDGLTWSSGHVDLSGWTCQPTRVQSNEVDLYVGGPAGIGVFVVRTTANMYSEPGVAAQCGLTGNAYRFLIPLYEDFRRTNPDRALYVYAISAVGGPVLLGNSGNVFVPAVIDNAEFVAQLVPPNTMLPGSSATVRVQMRNTGNTVWSAGKNYRLGSQNPIDNTHWGTHRVTVPTSIAPGQTATFDFVARAPNTTGARNFQWRMVRDGVAWFGGTTPNATVTVVAGSITAAPSPCTIPWGGTTCTATLQWSSNAANAEVWTTDLDGNNPTLFARAQNGTQPATWMTTSGTRFHLKAGSFAGLSLATVDVRGQPTINKAPSVTLTAPANGYKPLAGSTVTMSASASDADDGIARVEFLVDGHKVGEDTTAPFTFAWSGVAGAHTIAARAVDTRGTSTTSPAVNVAVTAWLSLTRRFVYDAHQQLCKVIEPETGATVMAYDAAGNLVASAAGLALPNASNCDTTHASVAARKVTRGYDARNRLATLTFPDGNGNQTWRYTPDGLPAAVVTANEGVASTVVNEWSYNKRRLLVGESQTVSGRPTWTMGYGYDGNGSLRWLVYPDQSFIDYGPNALGQPTRAGDFATGVTYHPNGAVKQLTYGNGIVHSMAQNARQLPENSAHAHGAIAVLSDSVDYDGNGNVVAITDGATGRNQRGNRMMAYDGLDRLAAVSSPMFTDARYEYDALDNMTRLTIGGTGARDHHYCYDAANRLTNVKIGGCSNGASVIGLGHDVQGNLSNRNGQAFIFDYGNRLRAATGLETYRYDGHGRRVEATNAAGTIASLHGNDGALYYQHDARRGEYHAHVNLGGSLIATRKTTAFGSGTGTTTYQHTDASAAPSRSPMPTAT